MGASSISMSMGIISLLEAFCNRVKGVDTFVGCVIKVGSGGRKSSSSFTKSPNPRV